MARKPATGASDAELQTVQVVTVVATQARRGRIGRVFTPEPLSIPLADLSEAELDALSDDPCLVIQVVDAVIAAPV